MGNGGLTSVLELQVSAFSRTELMLERSSTAVLYTFNPESYVTRDMIVYRPHKYADIWSV